MDRVDAPVRGTGRAPIVWSIVAAVVIIISCLIGGRNVVGAIAPILIGLLILSSPFVIWWLLNGWIRRAVADARDHGRDARPIRVWPEGNRFVAAGVMALDPTGITLTTKKSSVYLPWKDVSRVGLDESRPRGNHFFIERRSADQVSVELLADNAIWSAGRTAVQDQVDRLESARSKG